MTRLTGILTTGDQGLTVQPHNSLTLTLNCVNIDILLKNCGFKAPQPPLFVVIIFCQPLPILYWNLNKLKGIDVIAVKVMSSPKQAGSGLATKVTVGTGSTTTVIVVHVPHCPAFGVNVYVVVVTLLIAGDQLPVIAGTIVELIG